MWRLFVAAALVCGAQEIPRDLLVLTRVKAHMRAELARTPDYTCLQTVQRFVGRAPLDVLRMEVAQVDRKELFAWPGEESFSDRDLSELVGAGTISNGVFSMHARSLFVSDVAGFRFRGEERVAGRAAFRYEYEIPYVLSGFTIQANGHVATVACRGSFWADPGSLDVLRLEVEAVDPPPMLGLHSVVTTIDYARVHVGASTALLPQSALMLSTNFRGEQRANEMTFTHCRQYGAQSEVTFGEKPVAAAPKSRLLELPGGLDLRMELETAVGSGMAVGDEIRARVVESARRGQKIVVPAGAVVRGRVRRLEQYLNEPRQIIALEFFALETEGGRMRFFANMRSADVAAGVEDMQRDVPGVGTFVVKGLTSPLPAGLRMHWRTAALARREEPQKRAPGPPRLLDWPQRPH